MIHALVLLPLVPALAAGPSLELRLKRAREELSKAEAAVVTKKAQVDELEKELEAYTRAEVEKAARINVTPVAKSPIRANPPAPPVVAVAAAPKAPQGPPADLSGEWAGDGVTLKLVHAGSVSGILLEGGKVAVVSAGAFDRSSCRLTLAYGDKKAELTLSEDGLALRGPWTLKRPGPANGCKP
jgi:hypothetical protein